MNKAYLDSARSPEERTEILLKQMTLEEKAGQLIQITCMKADQEFKDGKAIGWIYSRISEQERYAWVVEKHLTAFQARRGSWLFNCNDRISVHRWYTDYHKQKMGSASFKERARI